MTLRQLNMAGAQCEPIILQWMKQQNKGKVPGEPGFVYDLSKARDVKFLNNSMGFEIDVRQVSANEASQIESVYSKASAQEIDQMNTALAKGADLGESIDYQVLRRCAEGMKTVRGFFETPWQAGICTVGRNDRSKGIITLEDHEYGPEVLAAIGVPGVYFLTQGYDAKRKSFPLESGIACYSPSVGKSGLIAAVASRHGHYAPETGVIFVGLPDGTAKDGLSAHEAFVNEKGVVYTAHNVRLGSNAGVGNTIIPVTGHTPLEAALQDLQVRLDPVRAYVADIMFGR